MVTTEPIGFYSSGYKLIGSVVVLSYFLWGVKPKKEFSPEPLGEKPLDARSEAAREPKVTLLHWDYASPVSSLPCQGSVSSGNKQR